MAKETKLASSSSFDADLNKKVIAGVDCPKCKSKKGEKCTTYNGRKLHRAHVDRYEVYAATRLQQVTVDTSVGKLPPGEYTIKDDTIVTGTGTEPMWTERHNTTAAMPTYDDVVTELMGQTPDELRLRNKLIAQVEGGLTKLYDLLGKDEFMFKVAEAIVDAKTDRFKLRNN